MSVASSASGISGIRTRRSGSRRYDESGIPLTPSSRRRSLLKPRRLQSAYYDEKEGVSKCRNCGSAYSHARPGARERREHKKYCAETLKVQHWLAFADFRDGHTRLSNAETKPVDDDGKAAINQSGIHSAAANSVDGAGIDNRTGGDKRKSLLHLGLTNQFSGSGRTRTGTAPRVADISFQEDDLERTRCFQDSDGTHATSSTGFPQSRSSYSDPSGLSTSGPVAASKDAEVHNLGGVEDVNKLQKEKQAGSESLQDNPGTSNEDKHEIDGPKMSVPGGDQLGESDLGFTKEGTVKETIDPANLPSAAKNWEDWEDVLRENTTHRGLGGEIDDIPEVQITKPGSSDVGSKKTEIEIEELHSISGHEHTSAQPGTGPMKQSLAERNWDDWDDVIFQSSRLLSAGATGEDAATLTLDCDTFDSRESVADKLNSRQRNNLSGPTSPDLASRRPQDDSAPVREGRDDHLPGAIALWKTHGRKIFSSVRSLPSNKAHDVGLVSSRSKSIRRMRQSLEKVDSAGTKPSSGRKAQTKNRSTISNAATRCIPLRQDGECLLSRSLSQGAEYNDTLTLVPTPDCTEQRHRPISLYKKLVEPTVSKRRRMSPGVAAESEPLAHRKQSIVGFRSWKSNFLRLIQNQKKYSLVCPRCESFIVNEVNMRKEGRRYTRERNAKSITTHEGIEVSDFKQLSREFASVGVDYDEWHSMSDSSSSEAENFSWKKGGLRGCIDYFMCP